MPQVLSSRLTGVVLCGGKSERMGQDKALIATGKETWLKVAYHKLISLKIPAVCSINATQAETFHKSFPDIHFIVDQVDVRGPLAGLFTVHLQFPDDDLLLLACDLPNLSFETLYSLQQSYLQNPGNRFFSFYHEARFEPMAAVYTSAGLKSYYNEWLKGEVSKYSLQDLLNQGSTFKLPVSQGLSYELHNFNTPTDISHHAHQQTSSKTEN